MIQFLLDTDILSLFQQGHATVLQQVNSHPVSDIAVSTVTLQYIHSVTASDPPVAASGPLAGLGEASKRAACGYDSDSMSGCMYKSNYKAGKPASIAPATANRLLSLMNAS